MLTYEIDINFTNKPQNLKLYIDEEMQDELYIESNILSLEGFISLEDEKIFSKIIYWNWANETGYTDEEIHENDLEDSKFMGKNLEMAISVTGKQAMEKIMYLSDEVQIGDYVNYDANSGLLEPVTYTTDSSLTGHATSTTFSSQDSMKWRVLSVNRESGNIELISKELTKSAVYFNGRTAYINAEDVLNDIGKVYGHGKGAVGGRSINIHDIEKHSSYDPYTYENTASSTGKYGGTRNYTSGDYFVDVKNGMIKGGIANTNNGYTECIKATSVNPITAKQTHYVCEAKNYFENETIYNIIFRDVSNSPQNWFWIASRCVILNEDKCGFDLFYCRRGGYASQVLAYSNEDIPSLEWNRYVSPIVSLKPNIRTSGKDSSGAWNLEVD